MKNIFDIKRFSALLVKDLKSMLKQSWQYILGIILIYSTSWLCSALFSNTPVALDIRYFIIGGGAFYLFLLSPSKLYHHINHEKLGMFYALLPVSTLEKFISMLVVNAIAVPILYIVALGLTDTVLTLLPFEGGFDSFIVVNNMSDSMLFLLGLIFLQSIYIFGNSIFKKHEFRNTTLCLVLIWLVVVILASIVIITIYDNVESGKFNNLLDILSSAIKYILNSNIITIVIVLLLYFASYWKLKKTTY